MNRHALEESPLQISVCVCVCVCVCMCRGVCGSTEVDLSLVPRPFPPPVFDRLQYKNGGEGLGERVTCVTSGRRT